MKAEDIVRLPARPLWESVGRPQSAAEFAQAVGVKKTTVLRWLSNGGIPFVSCDELAVRVGLHPMSVWGDDWYVAELADLDKKETQRLRRNERNAGYRRNAKTRRLERCQ